MKDYCDLCDKEKEVEIGADRLRVCEDCEEKNPNDRAVKTLGYIEIETGLIKFSDSAITEEIRIEADKLGKQRSENSANIYHKGSSKHRGSNESRISTLGILGELLARQKLDNMKIPYEAAPLVEEAPVNEPDFKTGSFLGTVDVKTFDKYQFQVNYEDHNDYNHRPEYYWFIKVIENIAEHRIIRSRIVDDWETRVGSDKYYFINKEEYERSLVG